MRFIKDHHKQIARVAAVVDGKLLNIVPEIVNHFVSAEVKHFDYEDIEVAKKWILE
ncbi:MAG: STAS/SEC14 domain-containing protein [Candidatus Scalinduaceae bacterium]